MKFNHLPIVSIFIGGFTPLYVNGESGGGGGGRGSSDESPPVPPLAPPNNDPPAAAAAAAGGSASPSSSADGSADNNDGTDYAFDEHAPELDYAADDYPHAQRVMHFLKGRKINPLTRQSVENSLLVEAGRIVTNEGTISGEAKYQMMYDVFNNLLGQFNDDDFEGPTIRNQMSRRLYNAKSDFTGKRLWDKFLDARKDLRNEIAPLFPNNLCLLPSGKGLYDLYDEFKLCRYKESNVSALCYKRCITTCVSQQNFSTPPFHSLTYAGGSC